MRFPLLKLASALTTALGLSACATHQPMIPTAEVSFVDKVQVEVRQNGTSPRLAEAVSAKTRREATRYGRTGAPKELHIAVTELHYKNPALALLVGDANRVKAHVAVVDAASGRKHGEFETTAIDNYAINGIAGAMIAAMQSKEAVDQRLADNLASDVLERVYGTSAAQQARKRPAVDVAETPEPAAAPAVAPKPVKPKAPKQTPVASSTNEKTAMVTAPTPQSR